MSCKNSIITFLLFLVLMVGSLIHINNTTNIFLQKFKVDEVKIMNDEKYIELYSLGQKMMDIIIDEKLIKVQSMSIGDQQRTLIKNAHMEFEIYNDDEIDLKSYKEHLDRKLEVIIPVEFIEIPFPSKPLTIGLIDKINVQEKNILVISTETYMGNGDPEAFYLSISEDTEILNEFNEKIDFEQLREKMKVQVYSRYMILESYPGQTGAEKIQVINE